MSTEHDTPAWMKDPIDPQYYRDRAQGNYLILAALLAFVAFTVGMVIWGFDVAEFKEATQTHEELQQSVDAENEEAVAEAVRQGDAAAAARLEGAGE